MGIEDEKEEETEIPNSEPEPGRRGSGDLPDSTAGDQPGTSSDSRLVQRAVTCAKQGDPEALHFLYVLTEVANGQLLRNRDLSLVGRFLADYHAEKSRLARAVGAHQADLLAGV